MKIHVTTLGCKVNQYESQALETIFAARGYEISQESADCCAIIVNSCAVTAESVRKSRQTVRRLRNENPDAVIALCGCWPQTEEVSLGEVGADILFGSGERLALAEAVIKAVEERQFVSSLDDAMKRRVFEELPSGSVEGRTRALLKIEDGCTNFCSYCIIPYARGPVRSLPMESVASEATSLDKKGYREIVVTGIEISSYGREFKDVTVADAIVTAAVNAPNARIRLGSLEPRVVTDEFCEKLSVLPNLCHHFHLSMQSGCDETLKRMNRKYDTALYLESCRRLRKWFGNCGITTDLIVGFPGETEEEFEKTLAFIRRCEFSAMHIFPYSIRKGTVAAKMDGQILRAVKQRRAREAATAAEEMKNEFLNAQVGKTLTVLFETEEDGMWQGHSGNYALVRAAGEQMHNHIAKVLITEVKNSILLGNIIL